MLCRCGAQRVMANLITYFSQKGYEVVLVNDFIRDEKLPHYEVPASVKRKYLRKSIEGNPVLKNIKRIFTLRKIIKQEKPDIVLSFLGRPNVRLLLSTIGIKCNKVVSVRNDPNREYGKGRLKKGITNRLFARAEGVVFQTEDAAKYFSKKVQEKSRIILNPVSGNMYVDEEDFERRDIITLGRLEPQKNHKLLIDAFYKIKDKYPDENLYIYGEGPLREETENYICELGLQNRVFLPGNIANVKEALSKAKVFVLSSDYEGLPNALMEAMATATPSVSTDCPCGGPKMLIQNNEQGLLVAIKDVEMMAASIEKMLTDENYRTKAGLEARKRAEEFRDETVYKQWEDYFLEIMQRR